MNVVSYELDPGKGSEIQLAGAAIAWVEQSDIGSGVTWIANPDLTASKLLRLAAGALRFDPTSAHVHVVDAESSAGDLSSAGLDAFEKPIRVAVFTINNVVDVYWQRSHTGGVEVSVVGELPQSSRLLQLLRVTVSPALTEENITGDLETQIVRELHFGLRGRQTGRS